MRKILAPLAATVGAAALVLSAAAPAWAYTLSDDGLGFVGKGEVQVAFNWSNADFQKDATQKSLTFTYDMTDTYSAVCEYTQETGKAKVQETKTSTRERSVDVLAAVGFDVRQGKKQATGINLTGFGAESSTGVVPVVGASCPGGNVGDGEWISVDFVSSNGGLVAATTLSKSGISEAVLIPAG